MRGLRTTPLLREAVASGAVAGALAALLLWLGPAGTDFAAHAYQRSLLLHHGFVLWNNFWYAGRYSFVTYSLLYYPLAALLGINVVAVASVAAAALSFAMLVGRLWGTAARLSSRPFAVVWAGTILSAAFPFSLGAALALLSLWALQEGRRGRFAALAALTLGASPLALLFLAIVLAGVWLGRRREQLRAGLPALVVAGAIAVEILLMRLFPSDGYFPFHAGDLIPVAAFCVLGAIVTRRVPRARPLLGVFLVYLIACLAVFAVPSDLGGNVERLRYLAVPVAFLAASLTRWRPLRAVLPLVAVAAVWNVTPLATNFARAESDPAGVPEYWAPALDFLHASLTPSFRVEAVDTLGHWPAVYLPDAGIPIVRGWYRQSDFPENAILYGRFGAAAYRSWLRGLGVRYVVLSDAPPDYSSAAEAALLRSGRSGLAEVVRSPHLRIFEVSNARPIVTGPGSATIRRLLPTRALIDVDAPGTYRVAIRFSPYWRTFQGCVAPDRDGMIRLTAFRPGVVDLDFNVNVHRGLEVLSGRQPTRFCKA